MTEHRHYSGPDLTPLLRQVRDELGSDAEIIRADRIRTGGLAGFFAREHYEVVAKRPKVDPSASTEAASSEAKPRLRVEPAADEELVDEPIGQPSPSRSTSTEPDELVASTTTEVASAQASKPTPAGPATAEPPAAGGRSGRSIQAALLDRADRVSTEELLVRVAETHSAEWGSESFQSILGRAMVDAVGPSVDGAASAPVERAVSSPVDRAVSPPVDRAPMEERRRQPAPVELGSDGRDETINGLRLESIGPGDNVIDPVPQPSAESWTAGEDARPVEGEQDRATATPPSVGGEGRRSQPHGPVVPAWGHDVPPPWGPLWMQAWAQWMSDGWTADPIGESTPGTTPHRLCTNCAELWSDLRREIDDVRLRLDDIIGTIRQATVDENGDDDPAPDPGQAGSGRRSKNNRRSDGTGR